VDGVPFFGSTMPAGALQLNYMGRYDELDFAAIHAAAGAYFTETMESNLPTKPEGEWIIALVGRGPELPAHIVGFVVVVDDYLSSVWVAPNARRHGLGRALCEAALQKFPEVRAVEGPTSPSGDALRRELGLDVRVIEAPINSVKSQVLAAGVVTANGPEWMILPTGEHAPGYLAAMVEAGLLNEYGEPTDKGRELMKRNAENYSAKVVVA
jgi:GNAT superfamily N-acetyltransferase